MKQLNRSWRIFATGFSFLTFGLGGLFLGFILFPFVLIFVRDYKKRKTTMRSIVSFSFRSFMYLMHFLGVIKFSKKNTQHLYEDSSCLLIANHPTLIDVVSIIAYCPNACCIVKEDLWQNKFVNKVLKSVGYIPNIDPNDLLEKCKKAVAGGDVLIVFPEGTRTTPGEDMKFQRGASHIALMLKCPVRCVELSCDPITLTKGLPWYDVPSTRANFSMTVKDKFLPYDYISSETPRPKAARELTRIFLKQYCRTV
jgi:1-acyl-sn-glycerol-3-phosphate acyltransferase